MLFPENFTFEHSSSEKDVEELFITVSPSAKFSFYKKKIHGNMMYIGESNGMYYTKNVNVLALALSNLFDIHDYKRIVLMGGSKGGYGALMIGYLCGLLNSDIQFSIICFSPQIQVYPRKEALSFPSHQLLLKKAGSDKSIRYWLEKFGSLPAFDLDNVSVELYYGKLNEQDLSECLLAKGNNINYHPLPISGHLTHIPFMVDISDPSILRATLERAYAQNATIEGKQSSELMERDYEEMSKLPHCPSLKELVSEQFLALRQRQLRQLCGTMDHRPVVLPLKASKRLKFWKRTA